MIIDKSMLKNKVLAFTLYYRDFAENIGFATGGYGTAPTGIGENYGAK